VRRRKAVRLIAKTDCCNAIFFWQLCKDVVKLRGDDAGVASRKHGKRKKSPVRHRVGGGAFDGFQKGKTL